MTHAVQDIKVEPGEMLVRFRIVSESENGAVISLTRVTEAFPVEQFGTCVMLLAKDLHNEAMAVST